MTKPCFLFQSDVFLDCPQNKEGGRPTGPNTVHAQHRRYDRKRESRVQEASQNGRRDRDRYHDNKYRYQYDSDQKNDLYSHRRGSYERSDEGHDRDKRRRLEQCLVCLACVLSDSFVGNCCFRNGLTTLQLSKGDLQYWKTRIALSSRILCAYRQYAYCPYLSAGQERSLPI